LCFGQSSLEDTGPSTKASSYGLNRQSSYKLTNCVANMRTVFSENCRSQRLNRSSRVEPRSSITSALYLPHGPKWSTCGIPSAQCHIMHRKLSFTSTQSVDTFNFSALFCCQQCYIQIAHTEKGSKYFNMYWIILYILLYATFSMIINFKWLWDVKF